MAWLRLIAWTLDHLARIGPWLAAIVASAANTVHIIATFWQTVLHPLTTWVFGWLPFDVPLLMHDVAATLVFVVFGWIRATRLRSRPYRQRDEAIDRVASKFDLTMNWAFYHEDRREPVSHGFSDDWEERYSERLRAEVRRILWLYNRGKQPIQPLYQWYLRLPNYSKKLRRLVVGADYREFWRALCDDSDFVAADFQLRRVERMVTPVKILVITLSFLMLGLIILDEALF